MTAAETRGRLARSWCPHNGRPTLVHVHVVASKPAPDSGAAGDAAKRWYAGERLTALVGGEDALPATRWDVPPSNRWSIGRYLPRLVLPSAR